MKKLRDIEFRIWLDDFGMGYSSLRHLKGFPISGIKIDQIFIANLMGSDNGRNMLTALIALARDFSVGFIAEGIDRQDSLETLKEWSAEYRQGMIIAEPISAFKLVQKLGKELS